MLESVNNINLEWMDVWEGKHIVWIQLLQTLQPAATSGNKWNCFIFYQRFGKYQILYRYFNMYESQSFIQQSP